MHIPLVIYCPEWIMGHFPEVAVRIGKVTGIASPKDVLGRFGDPCSGGFGPVEDGIHFLLGMGTMGQSDTGKSIAVTGHLGIFRQCFLGVKGQYYSIELEKYDLFLLRSHGPAQTLFVELL